jgi:C4-dicarboxylate transporter, DctM subunit
VNFTSPFALALYAIISLSLLGVPVGHAMIGGSVLYLYLKGMDMGTAAEQLLNGTYSSFLLLAIPLFILAATIMSSGSIMDRLLRFCNALVGKAWCLPACPAAPWRTPPARASSCSR